MRTVLSVAAIKAWSTHQVDVKEAFLRAPLSKSESIYARLIYSDEVKSADEKKILLQKSLYGLRQAPKTWYQHYSETVFCIGFCRSSFSECFFTRSSPHGKVFLVANVDDLLAVGTDKEVGLIKA